MTQQNLDELYELVKQRKENPIDGSYTDYLFKKGLDKILKKVGEETTEVIVAAKNSDPAERSQKPLLYNQYLSKIQSRTLTSLPFFR